MSTESIKLKSAQADELSKAIKETKCVVIVDYRGINAAADTELRRKMREAGVTYKVVKNSILSRAFEKAGYKQFAEDFVETTAIAIAGEDVIAPARIIAEYKDKTPMKVKCGLLDGERVDDKKIYELASIPSKEVLVAQLLGVLTGPVRSLAIALSEIAKKLAA